MDLNIIIASLIIAVMGIPHGALDPVIAHRYGLIHSKFSGFLFILIYLIPTFAVIISWLAFPQLTLILFLLISALHFGRDWQSSLGFGGFGYGALVVGLPVIAHKDQVLVIFNFLLIEHHSPYPNLLLYALTVTGGILLAPYARKFKTKQIIELALIITAGLLLSPLWYFVFFFCCLHSPRHLYSEFNHITAPQRPTALVIMTVITLITGAIAFIFIYSQMAQAVLLNQLIYQVLFIGLAALTVPHMCLLEWVGKHKN